MEFKHQDELINSESPGMHVWEAVYLNSDYDYRKLYVLGDHVNDALADLHNYGDYPMMRLVKLEIVEYGS